MWPAPEGNFVAATQYVTNNMTTAELVVASELFKGGTVPFVADCEACRDAALIETVLRNAN
jgi:hypothetical protein